MRIVVVPCFDEERRLDVPRILGLCDTRTQVLFVDDGSRDGTRALLQRHLGPRAHLLALDANVGKGEAVRRGLLEAIERGAGAVGYLDADLSAPPPEMQRLLAALDEHPGVDVVLGSRVQLLGRHIRRRAPRHYLGRLFATAASLLLQADVYDTQCGAKAFRVTPALRAAVAEPFLSRWAFDVELLARLRFGVDGAAPLPMSAFLEVPLHAWHDVGGSKLDVRAMTQAGTDLARIAARYRTRSRT
jgi:dolichyl-phosphate beta-glucosyltransferase